MDKAAEPMTTEPDLSSVKGEKPVPDLTGTRIGDYVLLRRLGQGGMGQVYLAEQVSLQRKVALKLLKVELAANEAALERFKREAMAVARATHANIVQVYNIGEDGGKHFMALEYVEGRNLRDYLLKKGPPELQICIGILRQVASALQCASELGVIHRDIKPENILITRKGEVKVADFGLSRIFDDEQQPLHLTQSGVTMGTPLYMSPEQVEGRQLDPRTDIYSLGVTAYHLLSGQPPFRGQTPFEVAVQHVQKEPTALAEIRPDLPAELCLIVHKMMAKKPNERYQTAKDIVRDLAQLRDQLVGLTGAVPVAGVASGPSAMIAGITQSDHQATVKLPPAASRGLPWAAALGCLLVLGAGAAVGVWWNQPRIETSNQSNPKEEVDADKKEEQRWLQQFKTFDKASGKEDLRQGTYACVTLSWLYLNRDLRSGAKDFKESEQFFQQLRQLDPPPAPYQGKIGPYRYLGELGEATVLAFRDEPAKSNELFLKMLKPLAAGKPVLPMKKPLADEQRLREIEQALLLKEYFKDNQHFRKLVAMALQRNFDNTPKDMQQDFPKELNTYRTLPLLNDSKKPG